MQERQEANLVSTIPAKGCRDENSYPPLLLLLLLLLNKEEEREGVRFSSFRILSSRIFIRPPPRFELAGWRYNNSDPIRRQKQSFPLLLCSRTRLHEQELFSWCFLLLSVAPGSGLERSAG